jgi:Holliday junction resolvase RusA-like endonuclease
VKYFGFKDAINKEAVKKGYTPGNPLSITFYITMPKSWSKRKKEQMIGKPHKSRPDLDNLIKAFKDSLLVEDSHIWHYATMEKRWSDIGRIEVYE